VKRVLVSVGITISYSNRRDSDGWPVLKVTRYIVSNLKRLRRGESVGERPSIYVHFE
jgi:hypothetical protein